MADAFLNRAFRFPLDPTPAQERLLRSYCGSVRVAYNWALAEVTSNLEVRKTERDAGVPEDQLTPPVSWSSYSLRKQFNQVKNTAAPWHREVSKHCFDTGVSQAAAALKAWSDSRKGTRKGRRVGFPRFKRKHRAKLSVSFVELNHQLSWLRADRHAVRLMLPQTMWHGQLRARAETLQWIHTTQSTRRLYRLVEDNRATIQKVTVSYQGGRWWVSFACRITQPVAVTPRRPEGDVVGVDVGLRHLATLSQPVPGLSDEAGHVPNPQALQSRLRELARVNRAVARSVRGSKNHRRLQHRQARLHGAIARTRALHLHRLSKELASRFETVVVEDLNVAGMTRRRKGHGRGLGRSVSDASWSELVHQLAYKTQDHGHLLVKVDRFYPSSKTCSECGTVKAKLARHTRTFQCEHCGHIADRDVNAAVNLAAEGRRLVENRTLAGLRPERQNGDPRPGETTSSGVALVA